MRVRLVMDLPLAAIFPLNNALRSEMERAHKRLLTPAGVWTSKEAGEYHDQLLDIAEALARAIARMR